jgi:hypothetical protein
MDNDNMSPVALFLFNLTDAAPSPWLQGGYDCVSCDTQNSEAWSTETMGNGAKHHRTNYPAGSVELDIGLWARGLCPKIVISFAPCTDLAVSGAAHFERKRKVDPEFQRKATELAQLAEGYGVPYCVENPISVLSTLWRTPDHYWHPCTYGGWLPEGDVHPLYPDVLPPRDAYHKKSCLWVGNGFIVPAPRPVAPLEHDFPGHKKLGGKSLRTKNIRSATPRGFARAVYEANKGAMTT